MKIGTLHCKLFGHKFVLESREYIGRDSLYNKFYVKYIKTDFCIRCGIIKEELKTNSN